MRLRGAAWGAAALFLAALLVWRAVEASAAVGALGRRCREADRELERLSSERKALRVELEALNSDPVYLEALLRRAGQAGPGERIVGP